MGGRRHRVSGLAGGGLQMMYSSPVAMVVSGQREQEIGHPDYVQRGKLFVWGVSGMTRDLVDAVGLMSNGLWVGPRLRVRVMCA